ncbi:glycosyltransferase [Solirubrobacter soli]|uniref:glycosyltransferase n=1 Tax=Solirubrobacter soli TaxID=363832 RepID=UPI000410C5BB|nr:glycosyltransferase [Solirubrobacter soli]
MKTSRADLHCHSTASEESKLGVQRALGLPECATPPEEVYSLAKRRGMDFVTITDHDTIDGVMTIADRPDVFVSEELTAHFRGEPQAVHILCLGITPDDHDWLQAHSHDVEVVAHYLHENEITCALAHPFYAVEAPLLPRHRRRLAQLFDTWEVRNGSRARELNHPAAIYVETHGGTGVGGSDDHAGVDIGRTWSMTPEAATTTEFLAHIRAGRVSAHGEQGSAAKWAHAAMALAIRALGRGEATDAPDPAAVLRMVERVMLEGDARTGAIGCDLGPEDARALLRAWLDAVDLHMSEAELLALLQSDGFSHADLERRARRHHERRLQRAVATAVADPSQIAAAAQEVFTACFAAIPYAPATAFLGREKSKLATRDHEPVRVALVADGIGSMHGVTHTLDEIRERGVPGFEVEVIGTDPHVDRRLSAVAEVEIPFYAGLKIGVPSLPAVVEALAEGRYGVLHLCSPGPAGVAAAMIGRVMQLPIAGSYHTELAAYTALRSGDEGLAAGVEVALGAFYGGCDAVLSPSAVSDERLRALGIDESRIGRWDRGVDLGRFSPTLRTRAADGRIRVLYAGRLTKEKGVDLLADAFLAARARDPRLELVLAGGGPEEDALRARLGSAATFLGWLEGDALARAYADADLFLFCSQTDTFGQVVLEAQASGLPVVAVDAGGPTELIATGRSGVLCPPRASALADAVAGLAGQTASRKRLATGGLAAVRDRTWEASLAALGAGWRRAMAAHEGEAAGVRAA